MSTLRDLKTWAFLLLWGCSARVTPGAEPTDCAHTEDCRTRGRCTWNGVQCAVLSDEDCRAGTTTRLLGQLKAHAGKCWKSANHDGECLTKPDPTTESVCALWGHCSVSDGRCTAQTADHCLQAVVCAQDGRCTPAADGECAAKSDADCARSPRCKAYGLGCTYRSGRCVTPDEAACRRTAGCTQQGKCRWSGGECVAASDRDCRASRGCHVFGACGLRGGACVATTSRHCRDSANCAHIGYCRMLDGRCVE